MPQETLIRLRLTAGDARAETGQIEPTRLLELFHDAATEVCIREVGDEGILRSYTNVEFLAALRVGDYVEVRARLVSRGRKTCTLDLVAHKVVRAARTLDTPLAGEVLDPPRLLARATGVWLVPERAAVQVEAEAGAAADDAVSVETEGEAALAEGADDAGDTGEGAATPSEPMSWGGHRPDDRPAPRRRPGPDVRIREDEPEPPPRREREERGGEWERGPREERREWRPRDEGGRGRDERRDEDRPPRDRPYGDRPRGGGGDRPYGDRPRSGGGDRPYGDRPRSGGGDRPYGDRPRSGGDRPYGDRPRSGGGDRPRSGGDRPYGDRPRSGGGDRPYGDRPRSGGGDRPYGDRPRGGGSDRPRSGGGDRPYGDRPRGGGGDRPRGDRPSGPRRRRE